MQIKVVNVTVEKKAPAAGRKQGYKMAEVVYRDDRNEVKTKKLVSFKEPKVFETLESASTNEAFEVEQRKDGDYWVWTSVTKVDDSQAAMATTQSASKASSGTSGLGRSNYETPEERALRQRLIVRQSSLAQAIEFAKFATAHDANQAFSQNDIKVIAEDFHDWVYQKPDLFELPNELIE